MDDHYGLPRLDPRDPENLLDLAARRRIAIAIVEGQAIWARSLAAFDSRRRNLPELYTEDFYTAEDWHELERARMDQASTILNVLSAEYINLGLPRAQFREIMEGLLESIINSLEIPRAQGAALRIEYVDLPLFRAHKGPAGLPATKQLPKGLDEPGKRAFPNRAEWLARMLAERAWSPPDVQKFDGPDRRTVLKLLKGKAVRPDVLEKLARALSQQSKVGLLDIPRD